jgi:hypothetical protein
MSSGLPNNYWQECHSHSRGGSYYYQESPTYSIGSPNSSISYSKVEELQTADDDKFIGKTEYIFNTGMDQLTNWRTNVKIDRSFIRSQLLNKKIYKSQGNDWVLMFTWVFVLGVSKHFSQCK